MKKTKLIATDLDGTFLTNDGIVSLENMEALHDLGNAGIVRVAATGRNLNKVKQALPDSVPFDFVVFSSGAGVYNWSNKKQVYSKNIPKQAVKKLFDYFLHEKLNFHAFYPVPENHKHYYYRGEKLCQEFERYFDYNKEDAYRLNLQAIPNTQLCQFLIIIKENELHFARLKAEIEAISDDIRVIRASSPITKGYIWIEVFQKSVSKASGVSEVCKIVKVNKAETVGIGNDYNDLDLLAFTAHSFLTANAPERIKNYHPLLASNDDNAFSELVQKILH